MLTLMFNVLLRKKYIFRLANKLLRKIRSVNVSFFLPFLLNTLKLLPNRCSCPEMFWKKSLLKMFCSTIETLEKGVKYVQS